MLPSPYVLLGGAAAWIASLALCFWLAYSRGHDDMRNAYTEQQLTQANRNLSDASKNNATAHSADVNHQAGVQVVHDTTNTVIRTVTIPADRDPFLPVGFVRLFDRAASRNPAADPYPGKSDGDPSDVRVSQAGSLLVTDWADKYYTCRKQVIDTADLKPILPPPVVADPGFFQHLNPF